MRPLKPMREAPKPRKKNVFDRLVERTSTKMGIKRHDSVNEEKIAEV